MRRPLLRITLPVLTLVLATSLLSPLAAQTVQTAATIAALVTFHDYYLDTQVVVRGRVRDSGIGSVLDDGAGHTVLVAWKSATRPEGEVEATGSLWDLGRMRPDDPHLAGYDLSNLTRGGQAWPQPSEMYVFGVTRFVKPEPSTQDTIRSIVLDGPMSDGRQVTVIGQFRGRNLFGDLPRSPGLGVWDFVISSANAAIWVTGLQPRGDGFELRLDARLDTARWLRVTGTVHSGNGLMWIEASKLALADAPAGANANIAEAAPSRAPPPEVLFSVPVPGQTDVSPGTNVRIQVSRNLDLASLEGHVRVRYLDAGAGEAHPTCTLGLEDDGRVLTLTFSQPLEPLRTLEVQLLDGIKGTDGQPLKPWTLRFTIGG
jgi:hypothetical protein